MRADRLLKLMLLLKSRGKMTASSLAEELEVSTRTILRDIDALSFSGVPIYAEGGHGGGISLDENYRVKLNGLKEVEVQALIVSSNASLLADIGLEDAAEQSLLKLLSALPTLYEQSAQQFQNRIYIDPVAWWHSEQSLTYLNVLQDAVYGDRMIEIDYQRHDGSYLTRTVQAYGLVAKASVWYLIAAHDEQFRSYRVSRVKRVNVAQGTFIRDDKFNLVAYWQESTNKFLENVPSFIFKLEIHPDSKNMATWYSPGFSEPQGVTSDGWYIRQYHVDSLELAAMFVVGLGNQVKVIEPEELKLTVAEKIKALTD